MLLILKLCIDFLFIKDNRNYLNINILNLIEYSLPDHPIFFCAMNYSLASFPLCRSKIPENIINDFFNRSFTFCEDKSD